MKYYFTSILLFLCFIALNGKTVSGFQTNDPFAPTTTSNDGSNIELYFDGYSHPNCANAEYLGDVVAYDTYVWVSTINKTFHFIALTICRITS